jgi:serine/threonine protein kinase
MIDAVAPLKPQYLCLPSKNCPPSASDFEIETAQIELESKLGSGTTCDVYLGNWNGMKVAVKQIDWNKTNTSETGQAALDREVSIMTLVNHEHLVKLLGVSSTRRPFKMVLEFCAGGCCFDLLHYSDHIDITWWQTKKMCMDVASAMFYLHSFTPQIIHRDLKSGNLLLKYPVLHANSVPIVKVNDFGLSCMKDQTKEGRWGKLTIAAGTSNWMAPEVFSGATYDEKVDVYSFAMILFEMICREVPFADEDPEAIGPMAVQGIRPDMEAVPQHCCETVISLMTACWDGQPCSRPSFSQILEILEQSWSVN